MSRKPLRPFGMHSTNIYQVITNVSTYKTVWKNIDIKNSKKKKKFNGHSFIDNVAVTLIRKPRRKRTDIKRTLLGKNFENIHTIRS